MSGLLASVSLLGGAYIMVSVMTVMGQPETLTNLWQESRESFVGAKLTAATYGMGNIVADPKLWYRYTAIFGVAIRLPALAPTYTFLA